jgi:hypothetical protein
MKRLLHMLLLVAGVTVAFAAVGARAAEAKQFKFVGEHPIPGGGFCHIHAPHVHVYGPANQGVLYRDHRGWSHFVGDPVAYGYDGPKVSYAGPHPVVVRQALDDEDGDQVVYCYLKGPHYHIEAPPEGGHFAMRGNVYWYTGDFPPEFEAERPQYVRINAVYAPIVYARPVVAVDVGPPPGWHDVLVEVPTPGVVVEAHPGVGAVVEGPGVGVQAGVGIQAGVEVNVPIPSLHVDIGGPPPPPRAVIIESAPPPPSVIIIDGHEKHGHGHAYGHYKKGHGF